MSDLDALTQQLRNFARERDWDQFHTPKNLAMAVASEAGELVAEFRWLTPEESMSASLTAKQRHDIAMEIADVMIFLTRLADVLDIDILAACAEKNDLNEARF